MTTDNIINLDDHRPPVPIRPSRLAQLARHAEEALCALIVASGICFLAWLPGHAIARLAPGLPWYVSVLATGGPAALLCFWAARASARIQCREPEGCSVNVHVFEEDTATMCRFGATGEVDGGGAA